MSADQQPVLFTPRDVMQLTGLSSRQLDYWTTTGLLVAEGEANPGTGHQRRYARAELDKAEALKALQDAGLALPFLRQHIDHLLDTGRLDVGPVTITYTIATPAEAK